jgi:hypothetical protein
MTRRQNIIATVGLALACVAAYKAAYLKSDKPVLSVVPVETALTKDDQAMPVATSLPSPTVLKAEAVDALPPVGEPPVAELAKGDGKEVLDAKEVLPPVGQLLPPGHNFAVDPGQNGPAMEHTGKTKTKANTKDGDPPGDPPDPKSDPLLADPNPQNISGPVVSQETR